MFVQCIAEKVNQWVSRVVEALPEDGGRVGGASQDEVAVVEEHDDGVIGRGVQDPTDVLSNFVKQEVGYSFIFDGHI